MGRRKSAYPSKNHQSRSSNFGRRWSSEELTVTRPLSPETDKKYCTTFDISAELESSKQQADEKAVGTSPESQTDDGTIGG